MGLCASKCRGLFLSLKMLTVAVLPAPPQGTSRYNFYYGVYAMANKKVKAKKPKQQAGTSGQKGGSMDFSEFGASKPPKQKKKKQSQ